MHERVLAFPHHVINLFTTGKGAVTAIFGKTIQERLQEVAIITKLFCAQQNLAGAEAYFFALVGTMTLPTTLTRLQRAGATLPVFDRAPDANARG